MEDVWEEENVWEEDVWEEDVSEMGRRRRRAGGVKTRRRRGTCEEERSGKGLSDFPKILLSTSDFKRIKNPDFKKINYCFIMFTFPQKNSVHHNYLRERQKKPTLNTFVQDNLSNRILH